MLVPSLRQDFRQGGTQKGFLFCTQPKAGPWPAWKTLYIGVVKA